MVIKRNYIINYIFLLVTAGLLLSCQNKKQKEDENTSRLNGIEIPEAGGDLALKYNAANGPLEDKDSLHAMVYMFNDYRWETDYLTLKNAGKNEWEFKFKVPENCGFIGFLILSPQKEGEPLKDNNNDFGFVYTVRKDNELVPGANLAWGVFRMPEFHHAFDGYFNEFSISDEALEFWVKKEIEKNESELPKYFNVYMDMAKYVLKERYASIAPGLLQQYLNQFGDAVTEKNYLDIIKTYRYDLKNTAKADSLDVIVREKFPNGIQARFKAFNSAYQDASKDKTLKMERFLKDYPIDVWRKDKDAENQKFLYDKTILALAQEYFMSDKTDKFKAISGMSDFNVLVDIYHWTVDRCFAFKLKSNDYCLSISELLISKMREKRDDNSYVDAFGSRPWFIKNHVIELLDQKYAKHIQILAACDRNDEIDNYYKLLSEPSKYTQTKLNDVYADYLKSKGDNSELLKFLEKCAYYNTVSEKLLAELKALYQDKNGSLNGFEDYYSALKDAKILDEMKKEIVENLTHIPYEPFKLSGPNGLSVNSEKFDDKIVVLDFWATWCGPCKKVFPGMQMLVDKYKNDANVAFYFIDTQESCNDYKEKAFKYIQDKGFTFDLLFDETKEGSDVNMKVFSTFSKIFNSSGIPRKVVLKNGEIRYTSEGFGGSSSKLVDELSMVIATLKNE